MLGLVNTKEAGDGHHDPSIEGQGGLKRAEIGSRVQTDTSAWARGGAENGEEYLEVLAQHRMTNDRHFRVFASGRVEDLPAPAQFYGYGPNATDEEKAQAEREYVEHNRRIHSELRDLGLLPPVGQNLPAHEINEYLRSGGTVDRDG